MSKKSYKDYLDKTFLEELNYKIWITKGCRFNASSRLVRMGKLSNLALNMISVYLTIAGLLTVYNISSPIVDNNLLAYLITSLSIVALVFGQIENSKDYSLKARDFHNCGLELSEIYNELRIFKTLEDDSSIEKKRQMALDISHKYQRVLEKYDNHLPIDNRLEQSKTPKYHELSQLQVIRFRIEYYFATQFLFHTLIVIPAIFITVILFYKN
ncbi:SLATT domain-containing protein [Flavobacterium sp. RNTU_13]|uniref:SLATT domain-containing protein n=1 Tax=Flavobacterium sp. RNTU_13 TaxID=3375145 RepID=UPI0039864F04